MTLNLTIPICVQLIDRLGLQHVPRIYPSAPNGGHFCVASQREWKEARRIPQSGNVMQCVMFGRRIMIKQKHLKSMGFHDVHRMPTHQSATFTMAIHPMPVTRPYAPRCVRPSLPHWLHRRRWLSETFRPPVWPKTQGTPWKEGPKKGFLKHQDFFTNPRDPNTVLIMWVFRVKVGVYRVNMYTSKDQVHLCIGKGQVALVIIRTFRWRGSGVAILFPPEE
jgi:hypothetical protein